MVGGGGLVVILSRYLQHRALVGGRLLTHNERAEIREDTKYFRILDDVQASLNRVRDREAELLKQYTVHSQQIVALQAENLAQKEAFQKLAADYEQLRAQLDVERTSALSAAARILALEEQIKECREDGKRLRRLLRKHNIADPENGLEE